MLKRTTIQEDKKVFIPFNDSLAGIFNIRVDGIYCAIVIEDLEVLGKFIDKIENELDSVNTQIFYTEMDANNAIIATNENLDEVIKKIGEEIDSSSLDCSISYAKKYIFVRKKNMQPMYYYDIYTGSTILAFDSSEIALAFRNRMNRIINFHKYTLVQTLALGAFCKEVTTTNLNLVCKIIERCMNEYDEESKICVEELLDRPIHVSDG